MHIYIFYLSELVVCWSEPDRSHQTRNSCKTINHMSLGRLECLVVTRRIMSACKYELQMFRNESSEIFKVNCFVSNSILLVLVMSFVSDKLIAKEI